MVVHRKIGFSISPDEMSERESFIVNEKLPHMGDYREGKRQASTRRFELHSIFFLLSLHHFGTQPTIEQRAVIDLGCKLGREFFTGNWWEGHKRDIAEMTRERGNDELEWVEPFRLSLLFAAINSDDLLLNILGEWPHSWMRAEWHAIPLPLGVEQVYFAILNMCNVRQVESSAAECKDKRIRMLYDACIASDNEMMMSSINRSLDIFSKSLRGKQVIPYEAIAIEETIITLLWEFTRNTNLLESINPELQPHILRLVD